MKKKLLTAAGMVVLIVLLVIGTYNYYTVTQDTIVVGYLPSNHDSALFVADALGMYKNEGLKVQLVPFRTGSEITDTANQNRIDIGYCGITPVTSAIDQNSTINVWLYERNMKINELRYTFIITNICLLGVYDIIDIPNI